MGAVRLWAFQGATLIVNCSMWSFLHILVGGLEVGWFVGLFVGWLVGSLVRWLVSYGISAVLLFALIPQTSCYWYIKLPLPKERAVATGSDSSLCDYPTRGKFQFLVVCSAAYGTAGHLILNVLTVN